MLDDASPATLTIGFAIAVVLYVVTYPTARLAL
jgi:hypothetical protein